MRFLRLFTNDASVSLWRSEAARAQAIADERRARPGASGRVTAVVGFVALVMVGAPIVLAAPTLVVVGALVVIPLSFDHFMKRRHP